MFTAIDFIRKAQEANKAGKAEQVEIFLCLAVESMPAGPKDQIPSLDVSREREAHYKAELAQSQALKATLPPSSLVTPQPTLESQPSELKTTTSGEIYWRICKLMRSSKIGRQFSFGQIADHVESICFLNLDRTHVQSERRERWRNHVSQSIEKLCRTNCLRKAEKNAHYVLACHP